MLAEASDAEEELIPVIEAPGALARHFTIGQQLLEKFSTKPASGNNAQGGGLASLLIDTSGRIVWFNGGAFRLFSPELGAQFSSLPLADGQLPIIAEMVEKARASNMLPDGKSLVRAHSDTSQAPVYLTCKPMISADKERLVALTQADFSWREPAADLLQRSFRLSDGELDIARRFSSGATLEEISKQRGSSPSTVRSQFKSILAKSGAGTQSQLLRLLLSTNHAMELRQSGGARVATFAPSVFQTDDDRAIPYHSYGPQNGRPIMFVHGMLDGCELTRAAIKKLHALNLRWIAPEQPKFGCADPDPCLPGEAPQRFGADVKALLNHLGISQTVLVGHMSGSVFAFAAASHLGNRAQAVVSIAGGVPIVEMEQISRQPVRQRAFAYAARFTPKLLPFLMRSGCRQIETGGELDTMYSMHSYCQPDMEAIASPEIFAIVKAGYHFAIAQGYDAFEVDAYHVIKDWSHYAETTNCPVLLMHGAHDRVVQPEHVGKFAKRLGQRASVVIDEGCGQFLLYRNPDPGRNFGAGIGMETNLSENLANIESEQELVERIYKIALAPNGYDDFMSQWETYIADSVVSLSELKDQVDTEVVLNTRSIEQHFLLVFPFWKSWGGKGRWPLWGSSLLLPPCQHYCWIVRAKLSGIMARPAVILRFASARKLMSCLFGETRNRSFNR